MTLNPFVYGSASSLKCFDEAAPCTLEQESMNVIANNPQDKYVPWLVCMDSTSDQLDTCDKQAGVSKPASSAPADLLDQYLKVDSPIQGTPTVYVDGKNVKTSYSAIKTALCKETRL